MLQSAFMDGMMDEYLIRARRLHESVVVVDTHCDTTQRLMDDAFDLGERHQAGHVDIPRLRAGGIDAVFLAVFAPPPLEPGMGRTAAQAQIERIQDTIGRHNTCLSCARTAAEVRKAKDDGRIAIIVAIEGGHLIEDSLDVLREYHSLGAAYLTLTHAGHTSWADSSGVHEPLGPLHNGLTSFGRGVVRELNRLGMMVDVSHVSD
ncbi:MAG: membrane dipeptidase, partial [Phycisphaerales bacterium]